MMRRVLPLLLILAVSCTGVPRSSEDARRADAVLRRKLPMARGKVDACDLAMHLSSHLHLSTILYRPHPDDEKNITIEEGEFTLGAVLQAISEQAGLACGVSHGALYVGPAAPLERARSMVAPPAFDQAPLRRLLDDKVSFCWPGGGMPLVDMTSFLGRLLRPVKIVSRVDADRLAGEHALVLIDELPFRDALLWLAVLSDTRLEVADGVIAFVALDAGKKTPESGPNRHR